MNFVLLTKLGKQLEIYNSSKFTCFEKLFCLQTMIHDSEFYKGEDKSKFHEIFKKGEEILNICYDCLTNICSKSITTILQDAMKSKAFNKGSNPIEAIFCVLNRFFDFVRANNPKGMKLSKIIDIIKITFEFDTNICRQYNFSFLIEYISGLVDISEPIPKV